MRKFICLLLLLVNLPNALASNNSTVNEWEKNLDLLFTEELFKPVGSSLFTYFIWDIYQSKLLTTSAQYPVQYISDSVLYEIKYFKPISATKLVEKTAEQWQHLGYSATRYEGYLSTLKIMWPDIKPNDTLTLVIKNQKSAFYYNKKLIGVIASKDFGVMFLDIWLSENTSEPELRLALLGRK
jgi:hypothetical protein